VIFIISLLSVSGCRLAAIFYSAPCDCSVFRPNPAQKEPVVKPIYNSQSGRPNGVKRVLFSDSPTHHEGQYDLIHNRRDRIASTGSLPRRTNSDCGYTNKEGQISNGINTKPLLSRTVSADGVRSPQRPDIYERIYMPTQETGFIRSMTESRRKDFFEAMQRKATAQATTFPSPSKHSDTQCDINRHTPIPPPVPPLPDHLKQEKLAEKQRDSTSSESSTFDSVFESDGSQNSPGVSENDTANTETTKTMPTISRTDSGRKLSLPLIQLETVNEVNEEAIHSCPVEQKCPPPTCDAETTEDKIPLVEEPHRSSNNEVVTSCTPCTLHIPSQQSDMTHTPCCCCLHHLHHSAAAPRIDANYLHLINYLGNSQLNLLNR